MSEVPPPESFQQALRRLRKARKLTLKQLAERLDVSESFISRLESGERHPSKELILHMGHIFFPEGNPVALDQLLIAADYTPLHLEHLTGKQDVISIFQEALQQNPQNFRAYISLIISLIRQDKISLAEEKIKQGFQYFDDQIQLQTLSSALELARGHFAQAIAFQEEALHYFQRAPHAHSPQITQADLLLNLGVIHFIQGYQSLDALLANPATPAVREQAEQSLQAARLCFEQALQTAPEDIYILDELARVEFNLASLSEAAGEPADYSRAVTGFKRVIYSRQKERLSYHDLLESALFLVHALAKSGHFAEAEHDIHLIECCLPNYWLVHYLKACLCSLQFAQAGNPDLLERGLYSLSRALAIQDRANRTYSEALSDPDLHVLRSQKPAEFKKLLKLEEKQ